jgi:formylglycine-generating enzyme required for sulfatase activity
MPKADKLPESIRPLIRRNAVEIRNTNFGRDAEALVDKIREARQSARPGTATARSIAPGKWLLVAGSATALLLVSWIGLYHMGVPVWVPWTHQDGSQAKHPAEATALKAKEHQGAAATAKTDAGPDPALAATPGSGQSFRDRLADGRPCPTCPEMLVVPAGDVMMGSPEAERGRSDPEGPQHRVTIAKPFAIGKFSITRGEFAAFVQETNYKTEEGCEVWTGSGWQHQPDRSWRSPGFDQDDRHPVVCVDWHDAKEFTAWLSKKVGKTYRLLTEAEREYAARANTATRYSFGDDSAALSEHAWYSANSGGATHPVGEKKPNAFGLLDMQGNAWAWCEDAWHPSYQGAPNDGSAWLTGGAPSRVLRGGSWFRDAASLRSAFRVSFRPDSRYSDTGFRVARGL